MSKPSSISINLPEPCEENWNEMKPMGCGRFCMLCEKTVIDFTTMTDEEVVKIMMNTTTIPCGRFNETQLNRPLLVPALKSRKPFTYLLSKVVASFLMMQALVNNAVAQKSTKSNTEQVSDANSINKSDRIIIVGIIKDNSTNEPLIGMEISVSGLNYVKYSDANGKFRFVLPESFRGKDIVVKANYQQTASKEIENTIIQEEKISIPMNVNFFEVHLLRFSYQILDKLIIETPYSPPITGQSRWQGSSGGAPVVTTTTTKFSIKLWLRNLFKKRKKS